MLRFLFLSCFLILSACNQPEAVPEQQKPTENAEQKSSTAFAEKIKQNLVKQDAMFDIREDDIALGNPDATVTIIQYSSPTCPHCAAYHKDVFPALKEKYIDSGKIRYVIREFISNKQDLDASLLARCAGTSEKFLTFMGVLYSRQDAWSFNKKYRDILTNIGQLGGINPDKFASCLENKAKIEPILASSKVLSSRTDFEGTPTFFINQTKYKGAYTIDELSAEIDKLLAK